MIPVELDLRTLLAGYETGALSARQVVETCLARIEARNAELNAMVALDPGVLEEADRVDGALRRGAWPGPLAGIPVVVKDSIDVAGLPTTAGWAPLSARAGGLDLRPSRDAPVVARLRAAGAVIVGKTNLPAFSFDTTRTDTSWAGVTRNAVDAALAPGASSAGTATAVAAGFALVGLGEETAGSILNPAAAQGLVGLKPTFGRVPGAGVVPVAGSTRDVVGPIGRTVADVTLTLSVLSGVPFVTDETPHPRVLEHVRLGLYGPGWKEAPLSPGVEAGFTEALSVLRAGGATLEADPFAGTPFAALARQVRPTLGFESLPHDLHVYLERQGPGAAVGSLAALRGLGGQDPFATGGLLAEVVPLVAGALERPWRPPDLRAFQSVRSALRRAFDAVMVARRLDALVLPQRVGPLPRLEGTAEIEAATAPLVNVLGLPAVTVPAGRDADGAPFGVVFVGRAWSERPLLTLARAFERARAGL